MSVPRPVIGVSTCRKEPEGFPVHSVGEKYVLGALKAAGGVPLLIPALGDDLAFDVLLERLDGVLLTGSPSNIDPCHYGGLEPREGDPRDSARDATTLPLLRAALDMGLPVFAICRGIQELNVALGGSLHQHVHELPGRIDHRSDKSVPNDQRYKLAHHIDLVPGGYLNELFGADRIEINSLHAQGIDRTAPGLIVEAWADDGTIEAVRVEGARTFALGVQWHPEWSATQNEHSRRLFGAFGDACRERAAQRAGHGRVRQLA